MFLMGQARLEPRHEGFVSSSLTSGWRRGRCGCRQNPGEAFVESIEKRVARSAVIVDGVGKIKLAVWHLEGSEPRPGIENIILGMPLDDPDAVQKGPQVSQLEEARRRGADTGQARRVRAIAALAARRNEEEADQSPGRMGARRHGDGLLGAGRPAADEEGRFLARIGRKAESGDFPVVGLEGAEIVIGPGVLGEIEPEDFAAVKLEAVGNLPLEIGPAAAARSENDKGPRGRHSRAEPGRVAEEHEGAAGQYDRIFHAVPIFVVDTRRRIWRLRVQAFRGLEKKAYKSQADHP